MVAATSVQYDCLCFSFLTDFCSEDRDETGEDTLSVVDASFGV